MKKLARWVLMLALFASGAARGQDLAGNWQGTLRGTKDLRMILVVTRDEGQLQARLYSLDESAQPFRISSIAQVGAEVKFANDLNGTTYEGTMNAGRNAIAGTWTQGVTALPLNLARATWRRG